MFGREQHYPIAPEAQAEYLATVTASCKRSIDKMFAAYGATSHEEVFVQFVGDELWALRHLQARNGQDHMLEVTTLNEENRDVLYRFVQTPSDDTLQLCEIEISTDETPLPPPDIVNPEDIFNRLTPASITLYHEDLRPDYEKSTLVIGFGDEHGDDIFTPYQMQKIRDGHQSEYRFEYFVQAGPAENKRYLRAKRWMFKDETVQYTHAPSVMDPRPATALKPPQMIDAFHEADDVLSMLWQQVQNIQRQNGSDGDDGGWATSSQ